MASLSKTKICNCSRKSQNDTPIFTWLFNVCCICIENCVLIFQEKKLILLDIFCLMHSCRKTRELQLMLMHKMIFRILKILDFCREMLWKMSGVYRVWLLWQNWIWGVICWQAIKNLISFKVTASWSLLHHRQLAFLSSWMQILHAVEYR